MKKNELGFGILGILLIISAVGVVSFAGWTVWKHSSKENSTAKSNNTSSNKAAEQTEVATQYTTRTAPDGYAVYQNKDIGFSFLYPKSWGELSANQSGTSNVDLIGPSVPYTDYDKIQISLWTDDTSSFQSRSFYKSPTYKPMTGAGTFVWKYAQSVYDFKENDTAKPQPVTEYEKGSIKVYGVEAGDGCSVSNQRLFSVKNNFVGINIDYSSCYGLYADETSKDKQIEYEKAYQTIKDEITKIPASIQTAK